MLVKRATGISFPMAFIFIKLPRPVFCLLLRVNSGCARPITGQVTSVTWPAIGWAQPGLTPSKRQKTGPVHTFRLRQNGCHLEDITTKINFLVWRCYILIQFSLKIVLKGPVNNESALIQIMLGDELASRHYLNQWWPVRSLTFAGWHCNMLVFLSVVQHAEMIVKHLI